VEQSCQEYGWANGRQYRGYQGAGNADEFFSDPVFVEKFRKLDTVSTSEFHTYQVDDLVLPKLGLEG
jgi:hypothetical protein